MVEIREVLELGSLAFTLLATLASVEGKRKEVIALAFGAAFTGIISLWTPGVSLLKIPSLYKPCGGNCGRQ